MKELDVNQVIAQVFALYDRFGKDDYIGEPVSQLEHMSQAAALAIMGSSKDEVILAAFFHDIGHLVASRDGFENMKGSDGLLGAISHEDIGGKFLDQMGFPGSISAMVRNHVSAKRYLSFNRKGYYDLLSEASKETLALQGGPMSLEEAEVFERDPLFENFIQLRIWDEMAKETNTPIIDLELIKQKARDILKAANNHTSTATIALAGL